MVVFVVQCFRVVHCRVKVPHPNRLWFGPVPQTIAYWGLLSFPDSSSASLSTAISRALAGGLHCFLLSFFGFQVAPYLLFAWLRHAAALCPGLAYLRHKFALILRWYSLAEILNPGLLRVASNSIGSPQFSLAGVGLNVPLTFRSLVLNFRVGLPFLIWSIMLCLFSFAIAHHVMSKVVLRLSVSPASQASCSFFNIPPNRSLVKVPSSYSVSAATIVNSWAYSVIVLLLWVIPVILFQALSLASTSLKCSLRVSTNCPHVPQFSSSLPST